MLGAPLAPPASGCGAGALTGRLTMAKNIGEPLHLRRRLQDLHGWIVPLEFGQTRSQLEMDFWIGSTGSVPIWYPYGSQLVLFQRLKQGFERIAPTSIWPDSLGTVQRSAPFGPRAIATRPPKKPGFRVAQVTAGSRTPARRYGDGDGRGGDGHTGQGVGRGLRVGGVPPESRPESAICIAICSVPAASPPASLPLPLPGGWLRHRSLLSWSPAVGRLHSQRGKPKMDPFPCSRAHGWTFG
jgi:hypothetical protein